MIPSYISHYFVRGSEPFLTISELDDTSWQELCRNLTERRAADPSYHRRFGPRYREVRLETEKQLRAGFRAKGGRLEREAPIYFCLGSSSWWAGFCDHEEIRIELKDIDPKTISFTYPDSFASLGMLARFGLKHEAKPYHGTVFTLDEITSVVREFGIPTGVSPSGYKEYHKEELETYIEAQLWSDEPLRAIRASKQQKASRAPQHNAGSPPVSSDSSASVPRN